MSDKVIALVLILALVVGIVIFFYAIVTVGKQNCQEKFGSDWEYRNASYGPDLCVNSRGEAKYL